MKKFMILLSVLATTFLMNFASANVWKQCGIGAMIFNDIGWAASISNIIWDLGSTATSSKISTEGACEGQAANTAKFINETYANIEEETALGEGQHLTSMLDIMGCKSSSHNQIVGALRVQLQQNMNSADYSQQSNIQKAQAYHEALVSTINSSYSQECQTI